MRPASVSSVMAVLALTSALADAPDPPRRTVPVTHPKFVRHGTGASTAPRAQAGPRSSAGRPGEGNPALAPPNQGSSNAADQTFLTQATFGGLAEVDLARLAEQKASSPSVREFAKQMIADHEPMNRSLRALSESDGTPVLDQLDPENRQVHDALTRLRGAEFDIEYLRLQVQAHQRMVQLLEFEIGSGVDTQVQRFASGALPTIFVHLATARELLDQTSMHNPQIASAPPRKASGMPTPQTPRARDS